MSRHSLFHLDKNATGSLQHQIRELLVKAILDDHLPADSALPSCRSLARQLGVGRNTVVIAYQTLVDDGYLISRERSGHYVNKDLPQISLSKHKQNEKTQNADWTHRIKISPSRLPHLNKPVNWRDSPFPFVYGQFDPTLFPIADWRECVRESVAISAIHEWAGDRFDRDDPQLTHQVKTRLLPRRGIWVDDDQILITSGTQHAQFLISQLLTDSKSVIGMEDPGYFDARNVLGLNNPQFLPLEIDKNGVKINSTIDHCDLIYTTPSHHYPTTATMPLKRRQLLLKKAAENNIIILEDDYETENNFFSDQPVPTLRSLDTHDCVLYMGSLSKTLAPGLRMGYLVGPAELIKEARAYRRLMMRHMPANNQQIIALFIKRGHYDSLVHKMHNEFRSRWKLMDAALEKHLGRYVNYFSSGGTSFWIQGPNWLDADHLQRKAANAGILIEAGSVFFMKKPNFNNHFLLGYSSISREKIEPGIKMLSEVILSLKQAQKS